MEQKSSWRFVLFAVWAVLIAAAFVILYPHRIPSASATTTPDLSIMATPSSGFSNAFYIGQTFTLTLTGGPANTSFTLCAVLPSGTHSCTPNWGTTNASGNWTSPPTLWTSATTATGTWEEGAEFPTQNLDSNGINFTMAATDSGLAGSPIATSPAVPPGAVVCGSPTWGIFSCPFSASADPLDPQTGNHTNANWFVPNPTQNFYGATTGINNIYLPTQSAADSMAACIGQGLGKTVSVSSVPDYDYSTFSEYMFSFPGNSTVFPAGPFISIYEQGDAQTDFCEAVVQGLGSTPAPKPPTSTSGSGSGGSPTPPTTNNPPPVTSQSSGIITSVQGFNPGVPVNQAYTYNTAVANTYLAIYGNFNSAAATPPAAVSTTNVPPGGSNSGVNSVLNEELQQSLVADEQALQSDETALNATAKVATPTTINNTVAIDGKIVAAANVVYQGATQINVSLVGVAVGAHTVTVTTAAGATGSANFSVTAAAATSSGSPTSSGLNGSPIGTTPPASSGSTGSTGGTSGTGGASATCSGSLATTVTVIDGPLNVRAAANTSAQTVPPALSNGATFTAVNEVTGGSVSGNDLWWETSNCNYVWSGGTTVGSAGGGVGGGITVPGGGTGSGGGTTVTIINGGSTNTGATGTSGGSVTSCNCVDPSNPVCTLNGMVVPPPIVNVCASVTTGTNDTTCTPGAFVSNCPSPENSCGMTNQGTIYCSADGTPGTCSAVRPADEDCPSTTNNNLCDPNNDPSNPACTDVCSSEDLASNSTCVGNDTTSNSEDGNTGSSVGSGDSGTDQPTTDCNDYVPGSEDAFACGLEAE